MIFNYGYGCCAFAHNICGSQPVVPDGMPDTSKPLLPEFFINPRCPPGVVSSEAAAVLEAVISDEGEHLSAKVGLDNEPDSRARVARESKNLVFLVGAKGRILHLLVELLFLRPCFVFPPFLLFCNQAP